MPNPSETITVDTDDGHSREFADGPRNSHERSKPQHGDERDETTAENRSLEAE